MFDRLIDWLKMDEIKSLILNHRHNIQIDC